ncbi:MAG: hypothetical protein RR296_01295, partial [Clostridia bacterium]
QHDTSFITIGIAIKNTIVARVDIGTGHYTAPPNPDTPVQKQRMPFTIGVAKREIKNGRTGDMQRGVQCDAGNCGIAWEKPLQEIVSLEGR